MLRILPITYNLNEVQENQSAIIIPNFNYVVIEYKYLM